MPNKDTSDKQLSFEEQLQKLEQIVQVLEQGELSLQESIDSFKEGVVISKSLENTLNKAQTTIASIIDEDGNLKEFSENTTDEQ